MAFLIFNNGIANPPVSKLTKNPLFSSDSIGFKDSSMAASNIGSDQFEPILANYQPNYSQKKPLKSSLTEPQVKLKPHQVIDSLENRRRLKASQVMSSPVITLMPHELLSRANQLMSEHDISHLVIINRQKNPLGVINFTDLFKVDSPETQIIQSILNSKILAFSEDTLVRDIALAFIKYKASAFAVVNKKHQVVGIINHSDLLALLVNGPKV